MTLLVSTVSVAILAVLAVQYYGKIQITSTQQQSRPKLSRVKFCPAYVPASVGFSASHTNPFPVATRPQDKDQAITVITTGDRSLAVARSSSEGSNGRNSGYQGRFAGQTVEQHMMNWLPAEMVRAIILEPPVILLGGNDRPILQSDIPGQAEIKDMVTVSGDKALEILRQHVTALSSIYSPSDENGNQHPDSENAKGSFSQAEGFTYIKSVDCSLILLKDEGGFKKPGSNRQYLQPTPANGIHYLPQLGVSLSWLDSCFELEVTPLAKNKTGIFDEYLTCDLELEGDMVGAWLILSSDEGNPGEQNWWLEAGHWIEISGSYPLMMKNSLKPNSRETVSPSSANRLTVTLHQRNY